MNAATKEIIRTIAPPIISASVLLFIIWLIYRKLTAPSTDEKTWQGDIHTNRLSYAKSQYQNFADALLSSFQGTWGDDEDAIYDVFRQMKTDSDVLQLELAWGKRTFFTIRDGLYYSATLSEVLTGQLSNKEIAKVNEILSGNGINITF
ncbi:MAG: hypothetical protein GXO88_07780 [Chlorobi bacterium]|nr:hypothetical protein [Chlorobiota bacterium]